MSKKSLLKVKIAIVVIWAILSVFAAYDTIRGQDKRVDFQEKR